MLEGGGGGEKRRGGPRQRQHSGGRFIIMIMALVTGLLAAAGLLCLLPASLPAWQGRRGTRKGQRETRHYFFPSTALLPLHHTWRHAAHYVGSLHARSGRPWRCTNWVHNYVLQQPPR